MREVGTVAGQHVEDGIDVAILVIHVGASQVAGQLAADVVELLAQLVEELRYLTGWRVVAKADIHRRKAGLGVGDDLVEPRQLLQLLLDQIRNLVLHLLRRSAGPDGRHDHVLDGEVRVFRTSERAEGKKAGDR